MILPADVSQSREDPILRAADPILSEGTQPIPEDDTQPYAAEAGRRVTPSLKIWATRDG